MPCRPIIDGDGNAIGIACSGRARRVRCKVPGCTAWSEKLCDWKLRQVVDGARRFTGKTCDMALCARHARPVAKDKDLCPAHFAQAVQAGYVKEAG